MFKPKYVKQLSHMNARALSILMRAEVLSAALCSSTFLTGGLYCPASSRGHPVASPDLTGMAQS
eukprot:scaffold422500_cov25-Prasinocladus_malaysianus.AAC.1